MADHCTVGALGTDVLATLRVGDKIAFTPEAGARWPWTVRARDERFIVATSPAPFKPKGTLMYTVVDRTGWQKMSRNGHGHGVVRSSLDILGGGWGDGSYDDAACAEILSVLRSGEWGLSHRRVLSVWGVEVVTPSRGTNTERSPQQA